MSETITSPELPVDTGIVHSAKAFSDALSMDLTDAEIKRAFDLTVRIIKKWQDRFRRTTVFTPEEALELMDQFEEELKYELATKLDVYATVDPTPIFEGEPPIVEFCGALPSHPIAKHGMDYEKKTWEVKHAVERGEDYYEQKGKHKRKK